jgi:tetratricopeptide (TPR) repeat protein
MWIFAEGDRAQARQLRAEALAALEAEQQALQLARRRFQLAMEAVQTLHSDVAGDLRLQQPEFSAVRTRLLEAALAFYERLLQAEGRQDEADPADLRLAADALREVATLCNNLADHERSVEANDRCRAILQRLVDSGRAPPGTYLRLVEALNALAIDRHNQGRRDEAHAFWQQADALLDLARGDPEGDRQVAKVVASMILGRGVAAAKEGRAEDARQLWWRCVELCRQVPAADRHADGLALPASMALMNLAMLPHPDEQGDRKERLILRAIAELRPQVEAQPGQPSFRATLRNYLLHLAQVRSGQRRWTDALGLYREAMVLSEQLVAEMPNLVVHQREALRSFAGLTAACLELLRVDEADQVLRAARSHCDRFVALEPRLVDFRINQVEFELATAELLELRGRFDEALVRYDRAQDRLDSPPLIETDHPAVPHLRSRALGRRVMALVRADRPDEAVGLVEAAAPDSLDPSNRAFLLLGKAGALATMGRPDEAMRSLREFDQAHLPSPLHYERAACWALMAAVSRDEGDGDRAIDALRRARSLDFFGSPGHTRRLEIDPSFDALRDRADFRSLLLDVAFPGDPFAPAPLDLASEVPSPIVASSPAIVDRRPRPE